MALFYICEEKYDEAIQLLDESRKYNEASNSQHTKAIFTQVEGMINFYKQDYESASVSFENSHIIFNRLNDRSNYLWSFSWHILAQVMTEPINQASNLKLIHEHIKKGWLLDIDFSAVHHNLFSIYKQKKL